MNDINIKLNVGEYYWITFRDPDFSQDAFIGQYTKFFGEGFYTMGVPDHLTITEVIVLGKVNTEMIKVEEIK